MADNELKSGDIVRHKLGKIMVVLFVSDTCVEGVGGVKVICRYLSERGFEFKVGEFYKNELV